MATYIYNLNNASKLEKYTYCERYAIYLIKMKGNLYSIRMTLLCKIVIQENMKKGKLTEKDAYDWIIKSKWHKREKEDINF